MAKLESESRFASHNATLVSKRVAFHGERRKNKNDAPQTVSGTLPAVIQGLLTVVIQSRDLS